MNWLLDVNLILASRWTTHPDHPAAKAWIASVGKFYTTAITELGFVRVSLSAAFQATWDEAQETLEKLHARPGHQFLSDDVDGTSSPETGSKDTTDAHLVTLARGVCSDYSTGRGATARAEAGHAGWDAAW